ncbi:MAG: diguanylate cyclase [Myxococcota bacterium]|nr:diguanylate cyclase [Myxococcota bacterium]
MGNRPLGGTLATILVIEDSETHRAEILAAVEASGLFDRILEAADGIRGLKLLMSEPLDLVLCDLEMPGLDGEKLLSVKEATPGHENLPFLFLTASCSVERRARLIETGACDAISKPFHRADLLARLALHLKVKRLQDELRSKNATLECLSSHDELTGLRNRRFTMEILSAEFQRARRYGNPLALLMADLDHFKRVNDERGHVAGDYVLRGVADRLAESLRSTDTAGRYGGEELIAVLPQNTGTGALTFADRWRQAVELRAFDVPDGPPVSVTLSVGVAAYCPAFAAPEDLVAAADRALYRAKDNGRNRVELAEPQ